jgi:alpha-galactosidase
MLTKSWKLLIVGLPVWLGTWSSPSASQTAQADGGNIRIEFNEMLHSRVVTKFEGREIAIGNLAPSESLTVAGKEICDFSLHDVKRESVREAMCAGQRVTLTGTAPSLKKIVAVTTCDEFPRMAVFQVQYTNTGDSSLSVDGWTNQRYSISAGQGNGEPVFWSYQSGSYEKRPDWVLPLKVGFDQENYLGMNDTDYGGGTPVVDVWRRDVGTGRKQAEEQLGTYLLQLRALAGRLQQVREEKRLHISREIHDELAQSCTALKMASAGCRGSYQRTRRNFSRKRVQ